jgi:hypothetical protein
MQKKDNASFNNQPNRTKRKEDKRKVTFHQENCLPKSASKRARSKNIPKCLLKNRKQKNSPSNSKNNRKQNYPHHRLIPSITSRLVGSAGPMSPPAKKMLLWIGSLRAMATANAMRTELASCALPQWRSRSTHLEWMGIPSRRRDCESNKVGWEVGGSMRCCRVGHSGRNL